MIEEPIEEFVHFVCWYNVAEKRKDPVACVHLNLHAELLEVFQEFGLVITQTVFNKLTVLVHAWQFIHVNVAHLVVFNQRHKQPECDFFRAMKKKRSYDEVHPLHITNFIVVFGERKKHTAQTLLSLTLPVLKDGLVGECAIDVELNL